MFMLLQPAPFATSIWHQGSLSFALSELARRSQGSVPPEITALLKEASGKVFLHESHINEHAMYKSGEPISTEPSFVYNGYISSLDGLIKGLSSPDLQGASAYNCHAMHERLLNVLLVVQSRGEDIVGLFRDPNLTRALSDFVGLPPTF